MAPVKVPKPSTQAKRGIRSSAVIKQPTPSKVLAKRANNGRFVRVKPDGRASDALVEYTAIRKDAENSHRSPITRHSVTRRPYMPVKAISHVTRLVGALRANLVVEEGSNWARWITWLESQLKAKACLEKENVKLKECVQEKGEEYNRLEEHITRLEEHITRLEEEAQEKAAEEDEEKERLQEEIDTLEADIEEKAQAQEEAKQGLQDELEERRDVARSRKKKIQYLECLGAMCREERLEMQEEVKRLEADAVVEKARYQTEIEHWRWYSAGIAKQAYACQFYPWGGSLVWAPKAMSQLTPMAVP